MSSDNCALYGGGGFWYYNCGHFYPNGRYYHGGRVPRWEWTGLHWFAWRGGDYSLKAVSMAFRATN